MHPSTFLLSLLLLPFQTTASLTQSLLWDENKACPDGFSGDDCTIPYELCPDERRKCFNNSICLRNNERDPITGKYGYRCDCTVASEISRYAGHECEYSATEVCPPSKNRYQTRQHFCTNGGVCDTIIWRAQQHTGCHCHPDFEGAHCQYLKAFTNFDLIEGESKIEDAGENFYMFTPKPVKSNFVFFIVSSIALFSVVIVVIATKKCVSSKPKHGLGFDSWGAKFMAIIQQEEASPKKEFVVKKDEEQKVAEIL